MLAKGQVSIFFPRRHICLSYLRHQIWVQNFPWNSCESACQWKRERKIPGMSSSPVSKFVLRIHRPRSGAPACCVCPTIQEVWGQHLAGFTRYHHTVHLGSLGLSHRRMCGCSITTWKAAHIRMCTYFVLMWSWHQTLWERVCFSDHSQKRDALMLSMVELDLNSHPIANPCMLFIPCACWRHWDI